VSLPVTTTSEASHLVDDRWGNLCATLSARLITPMSLTQPSSGGPSLCINGDNHRTTFCTLSCTDTRLSTIHSPYYPYYSLYNQKEKVSAR
jgi:hypothetical protein